MRKKFYSLILAAVMLFGVFGLTACTADIDGKYDGFSIGFNYKGGKIDTIMCAARSEKTVFDVNDVTLDFYFGWFEPLPVGYIDPDSYGIIRAALYFSNNFMWAGIVEDYRNIENKYFIREILFGEFVSETFAVSMTKKSGKNFSHKESLTIPKELFGEKIGLVYFGIVELSFSESSNTYYGGVRGYVQIWYEYIDDNTVRLSK